MLVFGKQEYTMQKNSKLTPDSTHTHICIYIYTFIYVVQFLMQIICYKLLGFCFYSPEQLFNFRRLEIEN